jgi:hypothetical protein
LRSAQAKLAKLYLENKKAEDEVQVSKHAPGPELDLHYRGEKGSREIRETKMTINKGTA